MFCFLFFSSSDGGTKPEPTRQTQSQHAKQQQPSGKSKKCKLKKTYETSKEKIRMYEKICRVKKCRNIKINTANLLNAFVRWLRHDSIFLVIYNNKTTSEHVVRSSTSGAATCICVMLLSVFFSRKCWSWQLVTCTFHRFDSLHYRMDPFFDSERNIVKYEKAG